MKTLFFDFKRKSKAYTFDAYNFKNNLKAICSDSFSIKNLF